MADISQIQPRRCTQTITLEDGETTTPAIDLNGTTLIGLRIEGVITNSTITFLVCDTVNGTFTQAIDNSGSPISITVASNKSSPLASVDFEPWQFIKIVAGSAQSGNLTIKVISKPT